MQTSPSLQTRRQFANVCFYANIEGPRELSTNYKARRGQILAPSPSIISTKLLGSINYCRVVIRQNSMEKTFYRTLL